MRPFYLPLALAAAALGCTRTETDTSIQHQYDPYEGTAYPDRRPKWDFPAGDVGVVSNNGSDSVSVLDLVSNKTLGAAPVGANPVDNDGPHHIAGDRARGFAYVALAYPPPAVSPGPQAAQTSITPAGVVQKLALDDLRVLGEVRVDTNPGDIVLSASGTRLAVSHYDLKKALMPGGTIEDKRANLAVIDPAMILPEGSPDPARISTCVAPHGIALSRPDAKTAYVACYGEDMVAVVNLDDPKAPVVRVPVGAGGGPPGAPSYGPYSAVLSPDGKRLAVGDIESKDVRFYDAQSQSFEALVIKTTGAPYFAAWSADQSRLFIPTQTPDAILAVDAATGNILTSRGLGQAADECSTPHEVTSSSDGATLYVVCEGDHKSPSAVLALDPATLATKAIMPVGVYPDRLAVLGAP